MALLTAPFPQSNPATLSELVLSGMNQLRAELQARTQISQQEQENWMAEGKMGASNMLGIQNMLADQRDAAARKDQNAFNNYLGLSKLDMEKQSAQDLSAERRAHAQWWLNGGAAGARGPALSDIPFGTDITGGTAQPPAGGGNIPPMSFGNVSIPPMTQEGGTTVNLPMPQTDGAPLQQNPLMPGQQQSPIMAPPSQPPDSSQVMTNPPQPGGPMAMNAARVSIPGQAQPQPLNDVDQYNQLVKDGSVVADQHAAKFGRTYDQTLAHDPTNDDSDNAPSPEELKSATDIKTYHDNLISEKERLEKLAPQTQAAASTTAPVQMNPQDLSALPYNRRISLGGYRAVEKQRLDGSDYLQFYQRDPKSGLVKAVGEPRIVKKPDDMSQHVPMAVQLPEDKVAKFDTAKFWLEKIYPGMDVKDRAANSQQAMQMHAVMTQLSNDKDVQANMRKTGEKDFTIPPGQEIALWKLDVKNGQYYPLFKASKDEDVQARKQTTQQIQTLWSQYNNWKKVSDDPTAGADSKAAAKAKADGLFKAIQQLDSGVTAPGKTPGTAPAAGTAPFYYGK